MSSNPAKLRPDLLTSRTLRRIALKGPRDQGLAAGLINLLRFEPLVYSECLLYAIDETASLDSLDCERAVLSNLASGSILSVVSTLKAVARKDALTSKILWSVLTHFDSPNANARILSGEILSRHVMTAHLSRDRLLPTVGSPELRTLPELNGSMKDALDATIPGRSPAPGAILSLAFQGRIGAEVLQFLGRAYRDNSSTRRRVALARSWHGISEPDILIGYLTDEDACVRASALRGVIDHTSETLKYIMRLCCDSVPAIRISAMEWILRNIEEAAALRSHPHLDLDKLAVQLVGASWYESTLLLEIFERLGETASLQGRIGKSWLSIADPHRILRAELADRRLM